MDRHEAPSRRGIRSKLEDAKSLPNMPAPTAAQFLRMLDECFEACRPIDAAATPALHNDLPALVLAENRLDALAEQGRGASHLDVIEISALVREAGSEKEPWK